MKDFIIAFIKKSFGKIFIIFGFVASVIYIKNKAKKEEKLENTEKSLQKGLEIKKDDAIHTDDNIEKIRKNMKKYVRR